MMGQLVPNSVSIDLLLESSSLVQTLRQELDQVRAELQGLRRENLELRQQVGFWKSCHRDALTRITALQQKVEHLEGEKRQLQADLFGRRSEHKPLNDRSNHLDDPNNPAP